MNPPLPTLVHGAMRIVGWCAFASLCVVGCSSGEGSPAGKNPWFEAYVQHVCASNTLCCKAAGKTNDEASCRQLYQYLAGEQASKGHFDASLADECLIQLDATRCDQPEPDVCKRVITGDVPAGSPCQSDFDCAPPQGEGYGYCLYDSEGSRCIQAKAATAGEPCELGSDADVRTLCDAKHGFTCDSNQVCQKLPAEGEACQLECQTGFVCNASSTCALPVAVGAACQLDECGETAYCSEASVCAAKKAWGEACTSSLECDGFCDAGKCRPGTYLCSN